MKNSNLLNRLLSYSHEKQSPQRFARYAAMLIMLLTLGVGQMWAAKERYIYCGISNEFDNNKDASNWGFNFWGGTSGGVKTPTYIANWDHDGRTYHVYRVQVSDDNNKAQFKGNANWWDPGDGYSVTLNGTTNNAVFWSHSNDGWGGQFQENYQVTSTASLAASSTSVAIGTNVTLTPSLSSNATYNEIKSTSYDVTTNPNSGGTVTSAGVFSATKAGSYTVTATVTYNAKDFSGITKTATATKTITVYATVTFDREGGSGGTGSQNATYNSATSNISAPSKSYHDFAGYWTEDDGTGTMVINASGVWQKNISNFTDNSSTAKWIILTNQTLHAKWTPKNYDISYLDKGGSSYSGSNGASLPNSYTYGTGVALTDGVKSGYRFDGWFDNSACTGDPVTSVSASDNGNKTFYALWTENPGGTVTLTAGTGGQVSKDNSSWGISKSYTGIKTTDALNIYAQASAGYTFSSWSRTSGTGTIASTTSASTTYTPVANADAELTANFTENTVTLTPSVSYDHGSSNYTASASNSGTVGVATTTNLSCSNPNAAHYTFAGWTLTNLTVTSGNAATDRSITVKITTPGSPIAAVANYNENLNTTWYICGASGGTSPFSGWGTGGTRMYKKSGYSTVEKYYCTISVASVADASGFGFKAYKSDESDDAHRYFAYSDQNYTIDNNSQTIYNNNGANDMHFKAYVTGDYEFEIDKTGANPILTIHWPIYNQVRISAASPTDAPNTGNFDMGDPVSNVRTVTRSLKANTTYTFKIMYNSDWYGFNSGTFTRSTSTSSNSRILSTDGGDMTLTTDYAGDYTFRFNQSDKTLSVDFPEAYKVTYGKGSVNGSTGNCSAVDVDNSNATVTSNSTWVLKGHGVKLTAPDEKEGYSWDGWYNNTAGTGDKVYTTKVCTLTVSSAATLYACYTINNHAITHSAASHGDYTIKVGDADAVSTNTTSDYGKTITLAATPATGYHFGSWSAYKTETPATTITVTSNLFTMPDYAVTVGATFSPTTYSITYHTNGGTEIAEGSYNIETATFDLPTTSEKTGYSFAGWYANSELTGDAVSSIVVGSYENKEYWAAWTPNAYTIMLSQSGETGYGSAGTASVDATYAAAMPAIASLPSGATGYKFQGYFTGRNGTGTQFTDANGDWVSNVTDTISSGNWRLANTLTLYAFFEKAEIATLPLSATIVHPWVSGGTMDSITVTPTLTFTPEPTVLICYEIQYSDGSSVTDDGLQTFRNLGSNSIRFRAPKNPGSYRVHAELKTDDCSGTVLDTKNAEFAVAGDYSVTVKYVCDGKAIQDQQVFTINALDSTSLTAPTIARYTFARWSATAGITSSSPENVNPKKFVASYDGVITAEYTETPIVYFKNNLNWGDVYVTYDAYWNSDKGTGNNGKIYHHMTHIEGTDIWYDEVPSEFTNNGYANWKWNIAFNDTELLTGDAHAPTTGNYEYYNGGNVIFRRDFDPYNTFFVPAPDSIVATYKKNDNTATYYSSVANHYNDGVGDNYLYPGGYWKRYNSTYSGWSLRGEFNSWSGTEHNFVAESADDSIFTTSILLYKDAYKAFRLYKNMMKNGISDAYTNYGYDITYVNSHQARRFTPPSNASSDDYYHNTTVHSATEGVYVFKIHYTYKGTVELTIDFPMHEGDYEVLYKDDVKTAWHPTGTMDRNEANPITSLFIRKHKNPVAKWRKCTGLTDAGAITWGDLHDIDLSGYTGTGQILEATETDTTGVYNLKFDVVSNALSLTDVEPYTGDYYIRTDAAGGKKWAGYLEKGHQMTYSEYANLNSGFSHYFMKYVGAGTNVKFVVANQYSPCISDTLGQDTQSDYVNGSDNLIASANIRYSWNIRNNSLNRSYVGMVDRTHTPRQATRFIVLQGQADMLLDKDGNALNSANQGTMYVGDNAIEFDDDENWVYETTVKAKADGRIKIYSHVNGHDYYLVGDSPLSGEGAWTSEKSDYLITGTGATAQKIRVIYDFKTGRLITAWLPSDEVNTAMTVKADVMIVRKHQQAADQINMSGSGRITLNTGKTVYGVMRFNKYILNNLQEGTSSPLPVGDQLTVNERSNYYISFPFDVKISDIFGFGSYGPDFTLRYYDGKGRAKNGYWADSNSFWKYVPPFGTLNANEGYLLSLNMNNFTTSSDVWNNDVENIELYFPATGAIDIQQVSTFDIDSLKVSEYQCTINRGEGTDGDRRIADSFWRCIGVPSFAAKTVNYNDAGTYAMNWHTDTNEGLPFLYEVNWRENDLVVQDATSFTFQPMHAYMVQNGNLIRWTNVIRPASVAQRTTEVNELTFRMELSKNNVMQDQTYIRLTDKETVTSAFDFGQDLSKEFRNDANIYTMIGYERAAANSMPLTEQTTIVPVGVKVATEGEYTFAMPDGTNGVSVILIDNIAGTRTNLGLLDYTVYLEAGQTDGRFSLEIAPIQQMPTDIEAVSDQHSAVRKVMIDGILYIVKDGKVFDARGAVVK